MPIRKEPTENLIRELYARFGLAYYHSEVLHRGLCHILATNDLPRRDLITRSRMEERLAQAYMLTFGEVIGKLHGKIPKKFTKQLDHALNKRNFLAHQFWFDRAHLMFQSDQVNGLIEELDTYTQFFSQLEIVTSRWFESRQRRLGITDDSVEECLNQLLSGHTETPLPDKKIVKALEKKLTRKQRLIRVWERFCQGEGKLLIFETDGGDFWQLCEVGLGWTQFKKIQSGWIEHPDIKQYLPANIHPRPKFQKPWEYEFQLKKGAILWVKPGKREGTFMWGIRSKNKLATE